MKSIFSKQDTADVTPHYKPRSFFNSVEGSVYKALSEVFDANTKVFAKVCLAGLVATPKMDRQYLAHWRRVQRRTIDFLVCSASTLKPILAIKLETELDSKKRRTRGPGVLEEVLQDIGLPLLRLRAQDEYDAEDLAKKINLTLKENSQPKPVPSNQPQQSEAITTTINRKLTVAAKSATNLWTSTKDKYRVRTSQAPRETSK